MHQLLDLGWIEPRSVDIADNVTKAPILVQGIAGASREYSRPHGGSLSGHLIQEDLMPVFTAWQFAVDSGADALKEPLEPSVEAVQVEGRTVDILIVACSLGLVSGFLGSLQQTCQLIALVADALGQLQQAVPHRAIPSCSMTRRRAG